MHVWRSLDILVGSRVQGRLRGVRIPRFAGTQLALAGVPFAPHAHSPRLVGLFAVVLCPILYGIIGGIGLLISALLYNLASGWVGGLELEIN